MTAAPRPWGWIAAISALLLVAAVVLTYAVVEVNRADAQRADAPTDIAGVTVHHHPPGQHTYDPVDYDQRPPVGGRHDFAWADCTGTVYAQAIRPENAVHSLEHGAVWITYDPQLATADDIATLTDLADGRTGLMLSPYPSLGKAISLQAWGHQLFLDSATDPRIDQFADLMTFNPDTTPETGATCQNPNFLTSPRSPNS